MTRPLRGSFVPAFLLFGLGTGFASTVRAVGPVLYVNGCAVLRISASAGVADPDKRVAALAERLAAGKASISTKSVGAETVLFAGDQPLLTVTHEDAVRNGSTTAQLAATWAARIRSALALPALKVESRNLTWPVGADRTLRVIGSQAETVAASTTDAKVVTVAKADEGVEIKTIGVGSAQVVLRAGGNSVTVNVTVRPWAADFPQRIDGEVVGIPADGTAVQGAVETALKTRLLGRPNAKFEYRLPDCGPLVIGRERTYAIPVRAVSEGSFANYGNVFVRVKNVPVPREQDAELWYSNNPEVLNRPRPLFSANLKPSEPVRLLYHHINGTTQGLYVRIEAINDSDSPARLAVIPGDSRPTMNPVLAGLDAASQYFRSWIVGSGEIVTIPPKSSLPLCLRYMNPNQTVSGLCGLRLLSDQKQLLVRTDALPPFNLDPAWRPAIQSSTPWRKVGCTKINELDRAPYELSEHIYPDPHKTDDLSYTVGGRYGFLRIGQRAILRQDQGSQLDGNFGVIYNIQASLANPTKVPTDVEIVFEASAGYSGGLFLIDGSILRTPLLQPKDETRLVRYYLAPGANRKVDITTLPIAGSSYPATLLIRPLPHLIAQSPRGTGLRIKKK